MHIFSYLSPEERVRKDHPLRATRAMVDRALTQTLAALRHDVRPWRPSSIAPEKLAEQQETALPFAETQEELRERGEVPFFFEIQVQGFDVAAVPILPDFESEQSHGGAVLPSCNERI